MLLAACGGGDDGDGEDSNGGGNSTPEPTGCAGNVNVTLKDFAVSVDHASAAAGDVTFCVDSVGPTTHEFKVVKSDGDPGSFALEQPMRQKVDESAIEVVGAIPPMRTTDDVQTLTITLEAGSYVLMCNVPTHYMLGMRTAFTVE